MRFLLHLCVRVHISLHYAMFVLFRYVNKKQKVRKKYTVLFFENLITFSRTNLHTVVIFPACRMFIALVS